MPASRSKSDEHSLTIGPDGPILLHDHYLVEQLAQFNRERVPERQPHARARALSPLRGHQRCERIHQAAVFQPGTTTETVIRFSTVAGERGSPDTWRDPRGFALKFYTTDGNYDIVGNDTPVFFPARPDQVSQFHPLAEASRRQQTCVTTTCSGTSGHCLRSRRIRSPG